MGMRKNRLCQTRMCPQMHKHNPASARLKSREPRDMGSPWSWELHSTRVGVALGPHTVDSATTRLRSPTVV